MKRCQGYLLKIALGVKIEVKNGLNISVTHIFSGVCGELLCNAFNSSGYSKATFKGNP